MVHFVDEDAFLFYDFKII